MTLLEFPESNISEAMLVQKGADRGFKFCVAVLSAKDSKDPATAGLKFSKVVLRVYQSSGFGPGGEWISCIAHSPKPFLLLKEEVEAAFGKQNVGVELAIRGGFALVRLEDQAGEKKWCCSVNTNSSFPKPERDLHEPDFGTGVVFALLSKIFPPAFPGWSILIDRTLIA